MGSLWKGGARVALALTVVSVAFAAVSGPASAVSPRTLIAAPNGVSEECSETTPCALSKAVTLADDGDSVHLEAGEYLLPPGGLKIEKTIDLGGGPGAVPILRTGGQPVETSVHVVPVAGAATLHDLHLLGEVALQLESGSADRIYVDLTASSTAPNDSGACELGLATLRDSVCWAHGGEHSHVNGLAVIGQDPGTRGTAVIRNVTAIAEDGGGSGLFALAANGAQYKVDGSGLIASSQSGDDVVASLAIKAASPEVTVALTHSNYSTAGEELPFATVTAPGTNGNQTAEPVFAEGAGNFHEAAGSPTIDGGLADAQTAALDLDGQARAKPGCFEAPAVPDIGAYERTATAACPPPPPPPPPVVEPPKPGFRIVKVTLHGAGGSVQVETPGAGGVTLTGSGVKLITRTTSGPEIVTMPIQPWAITRVRLKRAGRTKVHLKVRFSPVAGAPLEKARSVVLKKG